MKTNKIDNMPFSEFCNVQIDHHNAFAGLVVSKNKRTVPYQRFLASHWRRQRRQAVADFEERALGKFE